MSIIKLTESQLEICLPAQRGEGMKSSFLRRIIVILSIFLASLFSITPLAQDRNVDFYTRNGMSAITPSWDSIRQQLSPEDRQLADRIRISVVPTENVNAEASHEGDVRTIAVAAGLLEVIDWLATAQAVEAVTGELECETAYVKYLGDGVEENSDRRANGKSREIVTSPYQFYVAHRSMCTTLQPDLVNSNQRAVLTRSLVMNESIKYILGHELAHQVYRDPFSRVGWCEQQRRETRADAYSFTLLSHSGESPLLAIPILLIFAADEDFSTDDKFNSHPAALKRALKMVQATKRQMQTDSELRDAIRKSGRSADFNSYLDRFEANIEEQLRGQDSGCPD
jgi:hypothetical protein